MNTSRFSHDFHFPLHCNTAGFRSNVHGRNPVMAHADFEQADAA
ncbi:MAG: hypothetical protein AAF458_24765 [Pseudomonadota bacterium]